MSSFLSLKEHNRHTSKAFSSPTSNSWKMMLDCSLLGTYAHPPLRKTLRFSTKSGTLVHLTYQEGEHFEHLQEETESSGRIYLIPCRISPSRMRPVDHFWIYDTQIRVHHCTELSLQLRPEGVVSCGQRQWIVPTGIQLKSRLERNWSRSRTLATSYRTRNNIDSALINLRRRSSLCDGKMGDRLAQR